MVIASYKAKDQKSVIKIIKTLYESQEKVIKLFGNCSRIISEAKYKAKQRKRLKIWSPKQMLQRLTIVLAQVKAYNTSENLLNEFRQIIYSLYREKEIVYNKIMNSIKLWNRMDDIFMNSVNSKTSDPYRLLLNLTYKIDFTRKNKYVALSNLSICYTWRNMKRPYKNSKFKISVPTWDKEFELPDGSCSVSDIQDYFEYISKKTWNSY